MLVSHPPPLVGYLPRYLYIKQAHRFVRTGLGAFHCPEPYLFLRSIGSTQLRSRHARTVPSGRAERPGGLPVRAVHAQRPVGLRAPPRAPYGPRAVSSAHVPTRMSGVNPPLPPIMTPFRRKSTTRTCPLQAAAPSAVYPVRLPSATDEPILVGPRPEHQRHDQVLPVECRADEGVLPCDWRHDLEQFVALAPRQLHALVVDPHLMVHHHQCLAKRLCVGAIHRCGHSCSSSLIWWML